MLFWGAVGVKPVGSHADSNDSNAHWLPGRATIFLDIFLTAWRTIGYLPSYMPDVTSPGVSTSSTAMLCGVRPGVCALRETLFARRSCNNSVQGRFPDDE